MTDKKCVGIIEVKLKGEVYSRMYEMTNVNMVVNLINDMFSNEIHIKIVDIKKIKVEDNT